MSMTCFETIQAYGLRSIGIGEKLLPKTDFTLCQQFNNLKAMPTPLFDTQVAGMAAGFGEQIAYDALVRQMLKIELDKSSRFTDWARRPLSENQLTYAALRLGG